jgi:integrase
VPGGDRVSNTFGRAARTFMPNTHRCRETAVLLGLRAVGNEIEVVPGGLADRWADRPVPDITAHDIFDVLAECRSLGVPGLPRRRLRVSDTSARAMYAGLSLFNWLARRPGVIDRNHPVAGVGRPGTPTARDRVLDDREVRWFWAACDELGEPFGALLKLLLVAGARREEVARMTRAEISDDGATWTLPGVRTKNRRPHIVPLPPLAREIIVGVKKIADKPGFIFSTTGATPVSGFSRVKARLDRLLLKLAREEAETAGRDPAEAMIPPWRLHDLGARP